ncbi:MAG: methyltransferase domain-containing protein [Acidimicrobiia bacterium]
MSDGVGPGGTGELDDPQRTTELAGRFDAMYRTSGRDAAGVPWSQLRPQHDIRTWLDDNPPAPGARALVVAAGLGDDAVAAEQRGWDVTAFDASPTAVDWARERFPDAGVSWSVDDLFDAPGEWVGAFDLVIENLTIQSLPPSMRDEVCATIASWVKPGGKLLVVTFLRPPGTPQGEGPPWPPAPEELDGLKKAGLEEQGATDCTTPEIRELGLRAAFVVYTRSDEPTVVVTHAESPFEADMLVSLLESGGIIATAQHRPLEDRTQTLFSKRGTPVWVRAEDLVAAQALLDAAPEPDSE